MKRLLPLLFAGCVGSAYVVHPDPGFTPTVLDAAHAAAADWESRVPVRITFADGPCPAERKDGMICLHPIESIPMLPWEPGTLVGLTVYTEVWLAEPILERDSFPLVQRVIAHEMGHSMGLQHTGPGTLMYPYGDKGSLTVTDADVKQWKLLRGLP